MTESRVQELFGELVDLPPNARADWAFARAWLYRELS